MLPYLKVPLIWRVALYLHLLGFSRFFGIVPVAAVRMQTDRGSDAPQ